MNTHSLRRKLDTLERCPTCGHKPSAPAADLPDHNDPDALDKFQARLDRMQARLNRLREAEARGKTCAT